MTEQTSKQVERECIDMLFQQSQFGIYANLAVALVAAWLLAADVAWSHLGWWLAPMTALAVVRIGLNRVYPRGQRDLDLARRWSRVLALVMGLLGLTWGVGGAIFLAQLSSANQIAMLLVLGALPVAAVPFLAPVYWVYISYSAATLLPVIATIALMGDPTSTTLALLLTLLGCAFLLTARVYRRKLGDALRLAHENAELVAELRGYRESLELKVAERTVELQEANRETEAFNYSVSHDLRAPLRAIDGYGKILIEDYGPRLDQDGRDMINRLRGASQRMGSIIDALLQLSRLSRRSLRWTSVDFTTLAIGVCKQLREAEPERTIEYSVAPDLVVYADQRLMSVVLENLLSNAWKYTRPVAAPRVEVGCLDQRGTQVLFVRDNGVGFDMRYASKLFGAFQRLHTESEFDGTGIGLATVARIVNRHDGEVWADSREGEGATFFFTLGERTVTQVPLNE